MEVLESSEQFDVCIVGSGFSGTVLGVSLARRGARTLIIESGTSFIRWLVDARLKALASYSVSGDADYVTERTKARAVGGNSNFWTGRCERFHPSDFHRHPYTPPENPWPITYTELRPYYRRAEETLRVRAASLSHYAAPREGGFPVAGRARLRNLRSLLAKADVTVDESPTAAPRRALRFFRVQKELLPEYRTSSTGAMLSGATVTRLLVDHDGRVTGAEVRNLEGQVGVARAKYFVVACGGMDTPRLLLLSRSEAFPRGIGNTHDNVGRGFNEHPGVNFYAKLRHSLATLSPRHELGRSHQFYDDFRADGLGSVLPVFIQSWVFPNHLMRWKLSDLPHTIGSMVGRLSRPTLYIGATIEMKPCGENRVTLSEDKRDIFGNPLCHLHLSFTDQDRQTLDRTRALIRGIYARLGATGVEEGELTWSRHHIGTCRMGINPATSVADPSLRVHGCPNLYVCGSETFVTGTALPPVLTIVALAHRLADHLGTKLRQG